MSDGPVLSLPLFHRRLEQEVARVRRSGGFLSVVAIQSRVTAAALEAQEHVSLLADRMCATVRLHDVVGRRDGRVLLLLTDTTMKEAVLAAHRLLKGAEAPSPAAGIASAYGEVEGGGDALLAAADEIAGSAPDGAVVCSEEFTGRPRLLVVDDDARFAELLAEEISREDWVAHPCSQFADACERVQGNAYSGLFVDLVMPGGSGVDVLRRALEHNPRRPAVLMSGHDARHESIIEALDLGPVMFVRKPISLANLQSALLMFRDLLPGIPRRAR